jgi:pimeloyl-ACP methyl ester carboxylesterase
MPRDKINGVNLYWELAGRQGDPLVLVHGSWDDHHDWDDIIGELSKTFRVLTYDRRGHSQSERLSAQGNTEQDVADLIALTGHLGLSPAHIAGNSFGASIVLKTAAVRPDLFQTVCVHEPPLFGLLNDASEAGSLLQIVKQHIAAVADLIEKEKNEEAAKTFMETIALGEGGWQQLPVSVQQKFIYNAPTFYDETQDPESLQLDTNKLSHFNKPVLLTHGTESPPFFVAVMDKLAEAIPGAKRMVFEGAGHVPHVSHPKQYIDVVKEFCLTRGYLA